jgi:hypothetical protein
MKKTKLTEVVFTTVEEKHYVSVEGKVYILIEDMQKFLDSLKSKTYVN